MELLLGCGNSRVKKVFFVDNKEWTNLVTVDIDVACKPDVVHDLNVFPYPWEDNTFNEIHAYEVLEHLGKQGDYISFFQMFSELYRILKPEGILFATTPAWNSPWAWGDPGHTRIISRESLAFLSQENYKQVGTTSMTDYRGIYKADFEYVLTEKDGNDFRFALRAVKPARLEASTY